MTPLNPATQNALKKILDDYGRGQRHFTYDQYHEFNISTFRLAMYRLKEKTNSHLIRRRKAYYTHSDLMYEVISSFGTRITHKITETLPQANQKSYHLDHHLNARTT